MRYLVGFVLALAVAASPLRVRAEVEEAASPEASALEQPEPKRYEIDPELSPLSIRRWHPEAYDPAVKSERELQLELEYATRASAAQERSSSLSKQARIAIGVVVPVVVLTVIAAAATASAFNNMEMF